MQEGKYVILICGSRSITDKVVVFEKLRDCIFNYVQASFSKIRIIQGGATGVDTLAQKFAEENGIECITHPANWKKYGKSAGMIRNGHMVKFADYVIAIWDGESKGTAYTIMLGHKKGIPVEVRRIVQ